MATERRPLRLFLSYAHADEPMVAELRNHLKPLERQGLVELWYDRRIPPGADWDATIGAELEQADVVLFLLSSTFMHSDYCDGVEVRRALERHAAREALAVPVFLRPVELGGHAFRRHPGPAAGRQGGDRVGQPGSGLPRGRPRHRPADTGAAP